LALPGILVLQANAFTNYETAKQELESLSSQLSLINDELKNFPFIIVCDNADFVSQTLNNFLWVTFTRCNPSHDMYGIGSATVNKHWGCKGPLVFDARIKPHHAPPVVTDPHIDKKIDKLFNKGGSLYNKLP
jgi:4-hydroxy-3-polyprenylbenzoate decarboxylase